MFKRFFIPIALLLIGCSSPEIQVIVENHSGVKLRDVYVSTSTGNSYVEFKDVESDETRTEPLKMKKEEADGSYFIRVPDLDHAAHFGYYTNGSPTGSTLIFRVKKEGVDFEEEL